MTDIATGPRARDPRLRELGPVAWAPPLTAAAAVVFTHIFRLPALTPALTFLGVLAALLTVIDLRVHRLPNQLVLPAYPITVLLLVLAIAATPNAETWGRLATALAAAAVNAATYLLLAAHRGAIGLGDVKLSGVLGLMLGWYGWPALVLGLLAAFLLAGAHAGVHLLRGGSRRDRIPLGPAMLLGAVAAIAVSSLR